MKNSIKGYLIFAPMFYRIFMLLVLPVFLIGLQVWWSIPGTFAASSFVIVLVYMYFEIFLDDWIFGGIAAKGVCQPEYLKSSKRGMQIMRNVLIVSAVKPFVMMSVILGAGRIIGILCREAGLGGGTAGGGEITRDADSLMLVFAASFLITVSVTITRFFEGKLLSMCVAGSAGLLLTAVHLKMPGNHTAVSAVWALLAVGTAVLEISIILRRMKESYCDKTN